MRIRSFAVTGLVLLNVIACRDRAVIHDTAFTRKEQSLPLKLSQTRPPATVPRVVADTNSFDLSGAFFVGADGTIIDPAGAELSPPSSPSEAGLQALTQEWRLMKDAGSWLQKETSLSAEAKKIRVLAVKDTVILRGKVQSKGEKEFLLKNLQPFAAGRAIQNELEVVSER